MLCNRSFKLQNFPKGKISKTERNILERIKDLPLVCHFVWLWINQAERILTYLIGGSITVQLTSSFWFFDSVALLHKTQLWIYLFG